MQLIRPFISPLPFLQTNMELAGPCHMVLGKACLACRIREGKSFVCSSNDEKCRMFHLIAHFRNKIIISGNSTSGNTWWLAFRVCGFTRFGKKGRNYEIVVLDANFEEGKCEVGNERVLSFQSPRDARSKNKG